jgi:tetratricopeptide (TPR) repeat protein
VTGVGTGNWKIILPAYGNDGLRSEEGQIFFTRPHNDFIGVLAENGVIGFVAYSLFFLLLVYYAVKAVRKVHQRDDRLFSVFLFAGLIIYFVISMLGFPRERVEHNIFLGIFALSAILLHREGKEVKPEPKQLFNAFIIIGFLLLLAGATASFARYNGEVNLKKAMIARSEGDWQNVIHWASKAEGKFYTIDNTTIPVSWYSGLAYYNLGQTEMAFREFRRALQYHPYNLHVLNNLGSCYAISGNSSEARKLYRQAIGISSRFEDAKLNLTAVLYNESQFDSAMQVFLTIPQDCNHPAYNQTRTALLNLRFRELLTNVEEPELLATIRRIQKDPVWSESVFRNAIDNQEDFGDRIIRESVYVLYEMDQVIPENVARELEKKYLAVDPGMNR